MANFEKDHHEVKMVSETCDEVKDSKFRRIVSRKQRASSTSITIYEENSSLHSDASATQAPITKKGNIGGGKHKHLLRSGKLGMCNISNCSTCPTYLKPSDQPRTTTSSTLVDPKLHNNPSRDDKNFGRKLCTFLSYFREVMNPHASAVQQWKKIFAISCLVEIFIDPLFFFLIYVKEDDICVDINWRIAISLVVYRSINDLVYFFYIVLQFRMAYFAPKSKELVDDPKKNAINFLMAYFAPKSKDQLVDDPKKIAINYLKGYFVVDLFVIFPFPQTLMIFLPTFLTKVGTNYGKRLGVMICVQYLIRLIRFLQIERSTTGFKHITNFLIFLLFGHLVGSCWYLFGLQRVNECFQNACHNSNTTGCLTFIGCSSSRKNSDVWTNNVNATACLNPTSSSDFSYGIYEDAVPLTMEKFFFHKYLFALFWGFQQVMSLGDNLKPTHDIVLEVCFAMAIMLLGLWFFVRLVENIQGFLDTLSKWSGRKAEQYNWAATKGVHDLLTDIRHHLSKIVQEHEKKNDEEEVTQAQMFIENCKDRPKGKEIDEETQFAIEKLQDSIKRSQLKRKEEISILKKEHENELKFWIKKVQRFEALLKCLKQNNPHLDDETLDVMMENVVPKESNVTSYGLNIENVEEEEDIGQKIKNIDQE